MVQFSHTCDSITIPFEVNARNVPYNSMRLCTKLQVLDLRFLHNRGVGEFFIKPTEITESMVSSGIVHCLNALGIV